MNARSPLLPSKVRELSAVSLTIVLSTLGASARADFVACPRPHIPPTIAAYNNGSTENVLYLDYNGHLIDLQHTSLGWSSTPVAAADVLAPGSPLLAYVDSYGQGRIFFLEIPTSHDCPTYVDICEQRGNPPTTFKDLSQLLLINNTISPGANFSWSQGEYNCGQFLDNSGAAHDGVPFSTNLGGFQDTASTPTHHVFFFGKTPSSCGFGNELNPNLYELYASDSTDSGWTYGEPLAITPQYNNLPILTRVLERPGGLLGPMAARPPTR